MTSGQTDLYADKLERDRQLAEWKAQKKAEKEQKEREQKQAELEGYLRRRSEEWIATTGSTDGLGEQLQRWRQQYIDGREAAYQAEREARLAELNNEHYDRL
jgi:hypothetical protein